MDLLQPRFTSKSAVSVEKKVLVCAAAFVNTDN